MDLVLRPGRPEDAERCGEIFYEAFTTIAKQHNFPPDVSPPEATPTSTWSRRFSDPSAYAVVAELDGRLVGSNFLDERDPIAAVGPISVDPSVQDSRIGRQLMEDALDRVAQQGYPGVRLVQAAYNNRSLVLYTKLGFDVREPVISMQGPPLALQIPGYTVRAATQGDLDKCNQLCLRIHGHERGGALLNAIQQGTATVVEYGGRITGYATVIGFPGYAVGEHNEDLKALIGAAPEIVGRAGFLLPTRNGELFRWCLEHGFRVVQPMTLMSLGVYNEPTGAFLPSIYY